MKNTLRLIGIITALLLALPALAQDSGMGDNKQDGMGNGGMMGGQMLGGTADTMVLAEQQVDALPEGSLAWTVFDLSPVQGEINITSPAPGFLYAHEGSHTVTVGSEEMMLEEGQAVFVGQGSDLSLSGGQGLWHSVLASPDAQAPAGLEEAEVVASSGELQGIPETPVQLSFVLVDLPMGTQTAVHQHPGPEYIYVTQGDIEYETGVSDTETLQVGDNSALQANTAVQKRNPMGNMASFISWFVVDPDMPFASDASFQ